MDRAMEGREMKLRILILLAFLGATPALAIAPPDPAYQTLTIQQPDPSGIDRRFSALRDEVMNRLDEAQRHAREIIEERDRQYAQRFEAQQEALSAALLAQKEAVANALSAAKEAVTKAEDAANKRFESVNEFRKTLSDQTDTLVSKDVFKILDEKVGALTSRVDNLTSSKQGANELWGWFIGFGGVALAVAALAFNLSRRQPAK